MGITRGIVVAALVASAAGCAQSSYHSARMLPTGSTRLSAALTNYTAYVDGESNGEAAIELMGSHGLTDKLELGGKFSYLNLPADIAVYTLLVEPKYSLIPDQLALVVPAGVMIATGEGEADNAFLVHPGVVYSKPLNRDFELEAAGKIVVGIADDFSDAEFYPGANLGVSLSPGGVPFALHPEIGVLIPTGDAADGSDFFLHIGIAFHYKFGGPAASTAPPPPPP